ncbi:hypothetical protein [Pseudomonas sp. LRF_L74]|uniref:hypothetical protein n=1 Tax=Pseudomonas sp. LRF_L74 TaxID=3369422 RepID=UPI003F5E86D7
MPSRQSGLSLLLRLIVGNLMGLAGNVVKRAVAASWQPLALLFWSLLGGVVRVAMRAAARPELKA